MTKGYNSLDFSMDDYFRFCEFFRVGEPDECWEWNGSRHERGYGTFSVRGKNIKAHRVAFFLKTAFLPKIVHHECENTSCINPIHLSSKSSKEHMQIHVSGEKHWMYGKGYLQAGHRNPMYGSVSVWLGKGGEQFPTSKLKNEEVREIHRLISKGDTHREIAKRFGMNSSTIHFIRTGKTWKHIYREFNPEE